MTESESIRNFGPADSADFYRTWFRPKLLTKLTLRQLKTAIFSLDDKVSKYAFSSALAVTHTFVQFRDKFLTEDTLLRDQFPTLGPDQLIVGIACELFAPFLHAADSLSEDAAKENFTTVMKAAIKMRWYLDFTNLTEEVYNSLPSYGAPAGAFLFQLPITKLENFEMIPIGVQPLTCENLCHFLVLCAYHQKTDLMYLQYNTIISLIVALTKSSMAVRPLNQVVLEEIGVDPKLNNLVIDALRRLFVKEMDDVSALFIFERMMKFVPDSAFRLKSALKSAVDSKLDHFHAIDAVIKKYPDFPWLEVIKVIPEECDAFVKARTAVSCDKNYAFRGDLGVAKKQNFRRLCYVGRKLELQAESDERKIGIFVPRDLTKDRLDAIVSCYKSSGRDGSLSCSVESQTLKPELKQLYENLMQT